MAEDKFEYSHHVALVEDDGTIHRFHPVDNPVGCRRMSKGKDIVKVILEPQKEDARKIEIDINLEKGEKFIHKWQRMYKMVMAVGPDGDDTLEHGFRPGWNSMDVVGVDHGNGTETYLFVRPDGTLRLSTHEYGE